MTKIEFPNLTKAVFINRPNRFIANVNIDGQVVQVHVPSTGRMDGILESGLTCYLKPSNNPNRKTAYSLFIVDKDGIKICVDSLITNDFAHQLLRENKSEELPKGKISREVFLDKDRMDFLILDGNLKHYIEVKSVNKCENKIACFPDSPTERGKKHLRTLTKYQEAGLIQAHVLFVIQRNDAAFFSPCKDRDPEFAKLLDFAKDRHVQIHVCLTNVTEKGIYFDRWLSY